jgi:hypothetical protein
MSADVLKASSPSIIMYETSRLSSKLQQLLLLLPCWPKFQILVRSSGRIIVRVQRIYKRDVQILKGSANIIGSVVYVRQLSAMVGPKDWGSTCICRLVRPRWNRCGECF